MQVIKKVLPVDYTKITTNRTWTQLTIGDCTTGSVFMDSGAHSLFNKHILKHKEAEIGKHGRVLDRRGGLRLDRDYSWYDLTKGSELRQYLDKYVKLIRMCPSGSDTLFVTVDAILNAKKSFEIHQFIFKEYGIWTIPVIHFGGTLKDADRYLEQKQCDFLGIGSGAHLTSLATYISWADILFRHICPESNKFLPTVRTHGFAMTNYKLVVRYPWWSVDSATWTKLAAYGWMLVPRFKDGWRFDKPPLQINVSRRSLDIGRKTKFWWRKQVKSPRERKNFHIDNSPPASLELVERWLKALGIPFGSYDEHGNVTEVGASSNGSVLAMANLCYYKTLEEALPTWPHPLSELVRGSKLGMQKGLGL